MMDKLVIAVAFWGLVGSTADRWTGGKWSRLTRFLLPERRGRDVELATPPHLNTETLRCPPQA